MTNIKSVSLPPALMELALRHATEKGMNFSKFLQDLIADYDTKQKASQDVPMLKPTSEPSETKKLTEKIPVSPEIQRQIEEAYGEKRQPRVLSPEYCEKRQTHDWGPTAYDENGQVIHANCKICGKYWFYSS